MDKGITSRGLRACSLFKTLFIGHAFSFGMFMLLAGALGFFGYAIVFQQGDPAFGATRLMPGIIAAGCFSSCSGSSLDFSLHR